MRKHFAWVLVFLLAIASLSSATTPNKYRCYSTTVSASNVNSAVTFTDNGSGGDSAAFNASEVNFYNAGTATVYIDCKDTTATTSDMPLRSGLSFRFAYPNPDGSHGAGFAGCGIITASSTASVDVIAIRTAE